MMTAQGLIAISGILGSIAALYLAKSAYDRSFRATEPDEELVKRFVESAPVCRLKDITSEDNFEDITRNHPTLGSRDARTVYERLRTMYVDQAQQKGWYLGEGSVDYRVAGRMLASGWAEADVASAIRERSPNIEDRYRDPDEYAERTAKNARGELERKDENFRRWLGDYP
jgi:DNA primase RepB-like protein